LSRSDAGKARRVLDAIWPAFDRLSVSEKVVYDAGDLADRRSLRGFDAIHLASALLQAPGIAVATWDERLSDAAEAEGLTLAR
jgi:predicted nucleic acid-binding protein